MDTEYETGREVGGNHDKPKRVLVFAGEFSTSESDRWLLDDLVDDFVLQGAEVDVVVSDNRRIRPRGVDFRNSGKVRTISVGPEKAPRGSAGRVLARLLAAARMHTLAYGILMRETYDVGVFTSVAATTAGLPRRLRVAGVIKHLVFVEWDFFPIHQIEIGRLPANALIRALRHIEFFSIAKADTVTVMSPANEAFFRNYFPNYRGRLMVLPPWARSDTAATMTVPKVDKFTAVFGGQLVRGRGVESILQAAAILGRQNSDINIIIAGDGPLRKGYEELAASLELKNVIFVGSVPRPVYRELLKTLHVGIAVTVTGVSVPAFPSKIVEYCSSSIPVVACLDTASDGGDLLVEFGAGLVIDANDEKALADSLIGLESSHREGTLESMAAAAKRLFDSRLSSEHAAQLIMSIVQNEPME